MIDLGAAAPLAAAEREPSAIVSPLRPTPHIRLETAIPGPRSQALVAEERQYLAPGTQGIWRMAGIAGHAGDGAILEDVDGNRFVDLVAGIGVGSLGYGHKKQAQALAEQAQKLIVGSYTTEPRLRLVKRLAEVTPKGSKLTRTQLYSGGAEAVESALRLARAHTQKFEVVSFWGGFHGKTQGVLGLMGSDFKRGLGPQQPGLYQVPYADCANCPFKQKPDCCDLSCVQFMRESLKKQTTHSIAAIIVEPIQGTAGNIVPPDKFLPAVHEVAKEFDALLISDEMICGFGRSGKMFGCEHSGVVPDIITIGKALGGGFPVAGLITRDELCEARPWSQDSFSSSSYGGNPLAAAAADFAVKTVVEENLTARARKLGERFLRTLEGFAERYPFIDNVRGRGLMLGFDLVRDKKSKKLLDKSICKQIFEGALKRGLITMAYAPRVRINPPLVITAEQLDEAAGVLEDTFEEMLRSRAYLT